MKKMMVIAVIGCLVFTAAAIVPDAQAEETALTKLGSGFMNILDAPFEIPGTMLRTGKLEGVPNALTKGVLMGALNTCVRLLAGVYEVATFPLPFPDGYGPVMKDSPQFLSME